MNGKFITFEGGEGSGKTTIIKQIMAILEQKGFECVVTREPGGTPISEKIRDVILDVNNDMDARTEAQLYAASRTEHLYRKILPALAEGKIVLCDRYLDSSLVYQGIARNLGIDDVMSINYYATKNLPDVTFFFDIKPAVAFKRIAVNNREMNRLDLESLEFHNAVYAGYKLLSEKYKERIVTINADDTVENVVAAVMEHLTRLFKGCAKDEPENCFSTVKA